jgi:hypothetical protein
MTDCPTEQERARFEALREVRREVRRWARETTGSRDLSTDDYVSAHRVDEALQRFHAAAA